jgi:bacterioferritin-associated ferredoxin
MIRFNPSTCPLNKELKTANLSSSLLKGGFIFNKLSFVKAKEEFNRAWWLVAPLVTFIPSFLALVTKSIAPLVEMWAMCKNITDQQIEDLVKTKEAMSIDQLRDITGFGTVCGKCQFKVHQLFEELMHIYHE